MSGLLGPNQILTDFNVDNVYNEEEVAAKIEEVDSTFHLVMIRERFQESLVLMRSILGWTLDDIKNIKINARKETEENALKPYTRAALRAIMSPDYKMYNHFKDKLDVMIESFGEKRMEEEVWRLEKLNKEVMESCDFTQTVNKWVSWVDLVEYQVKNILHYNQPYHFHFFQFRGDGNRTQNSKLCELMTLAEPTFVKRIRKQLQEIYPDSLPSKG